MKPFLERLSTRPPPADFRPATPPPPRPTRAEDAGLHQSLSACGRSGWGLRDSKGAPPPRSGFPGQGCRRKTPSAGAPGSKLTFAPAGWNMEDLEEDVKFIADETLDFGGLSPSDSREEEDTAVSVTPEKPLRRGLSHRSDPNAVAPAPQSLRLSLGPLSPEKLEEILSEANRLAAHLEQCALQERENTGEGPGPRRVKPSPRRETFVLKDSPVRDLLPTVSSLSRSTPSPSSLTPRLRSSDRKVSVRALRATSGKRPSGMKRAHLPLSDQSWLHSLLPATLSACLGHREQLLNLPVDCLFRRPFPGLPAGCHSPAGVYHPAKVPFLQIPCQLGKDFQDQVPQGTEFLFLSDQIFPSLVPVAAICSPPGKLQSQDLPGKEIRTASKNSVANYYSHCLDSPLYSASQALSLEAGLTPADSGPGTEGRAATMAGAPGVETMGDRVDSG
ncbi:proline/serine-rich coiled-coil protein 1 isoform X1 [Orcinus orca]|uniref:proline/serine-rich coiled-coil protein 1 isoform X1 n=1 Tax=Orcinus orca TaxID=9733 RepID=UPI002111E995|nr:proline/serine-rich coiled-coil protein 1 isoform X1 [Orcinus orca]